MDNKDFFEKNIKNGLDSAFENEGITVSDELFNRTLASIRELPGADMNKTITEKTPVVASSGRNRLYKRFAYIGSGVAAAFLVGFISVNLLGNIGSKSSSKDMAAMDFEASTVITESKLESAASSAMSEEEVFENFAADSDFEYDKSADVSLDDGFAGNTDITTSVQIDYTASDPSAKDIAAPESPATEPGAPAQGFVGFFPAESTESELEPAAPEEAPDFESIDHVERPAEDSLESVQNDDVLLYNMVCSFLGSDNLYGSVQYISNETAGSDFEMETKFLAALGAESKQSAGISPSDVYSGQSQVDVMFIKNNNGGSVMIRIDDYYFKGEYDKELKIQEVKGYKLKLSDFILPDDKVPDDLPVEEYVGDGPIELTDPIRVDH